MVKMTAKVIEYDHGMKHIERAIRSAGNRKIISEAGFPVGGKAAPGRYNYSELLKVAASHELGEPRRPFISQSFDVNTPKYIREVEKLTRRFTGGMSDLKEEVKRLGGMQAMDKKEEIDKGNFAPLSQSTIERKGHDHPLIETGQMQDTIQSKVVIK